MKLLPLGWYQASDPLVCLADWLNVIPSPALGLCLLDQEVRLCLNYWLGLRMADDVSSCSVCGKSPAADLLGDHQVGYGGNGDRIHRHYTIRDALFSAAQSAALAPRKEVPTLIPGTRSRLADIFLPDWCSPAALDVTVVSTMQPLTQLGTASEKGYALKLAEERKMEARNAECRGAGVLFVHLADDDVQMQM